MDLWPRTPVITLSGPAHAKAYFSRNSVVCVYGDRSDSIVTDGTRRPVEAAMGMGKRFVGQRRRSRQCP
jgi:hypothetical protein